MPGHFQGQEYHFFHLSFNRELTELYASSAIRNFAIGLIVLFEPIYIYLFFDHSLSNTLIFFGLSSLLTGLLVVFGAKVLAYIGIKKTMLLSVPFLFLYYLGLWQIEAIRPFVYALPLLMAVFNILYWPAYHADFTRFSDQSKRGKQLSYRFIILSAVASVAPLVGGFLIATVGFEVVFAVVLGLLFASLAPLFLSDEIHEEYRDSYTKTFRSIFKREHRDKAFAFASNGAEIAIQEKIWPLYLFILGISFKELGLITTGAMVIGIVFLFFIGRITDRVGAARMLLAGGVLNAIFWPIKAFVRTPFDAFLIQTLHGFGRGGQPMFPSGPLCTTGSVLMVRDGSGQLFFVQLYSIHPPA